MAPEILAIVAVVVLFTGMFLALLFSYRDIEEKRAQQPPAQVRQPRPALYGWEGHSQAVAEELMLRQIEHHLRREAMLAEQFVMDPSQQTLQAGGDLRLGVH